jgi:hypothetical protein
MFSSLFIFREGIKGKIGEGEGLMLRGGGDGGGVQ